MMTRIELQGPKRVLTEFRAGAFLCAVSGGLDSMCLLHLLSTWGREQGFRVAAAHFNHQLRPTADRDEAFVRDICGQWAIPLTVGRGDVGAFSKKQGLSTEEAARILRYEFLHQTARSLGDAEILTAHQADDNAETMLLNLVRGTGLKGLTGIPPCRDGVLRPFLEVTRQELEAYAAAHKIPHVEDETNQDPDAASRNFLRHKVFPLLRELNPRAVEHMTNAAAILNREDQALDALAARERSRAAETPAGFTVSLTALNDWPRAVSERMLLQEMGRLANGRRDFTARHVQALLALHPGGSCSLPHGLSARREGDEFYLERAPSRLPACAIAIGETLNFGQWTITLDTAPGKGAPLSLPEDAPLTVTAWQAGDRMTLPGAKGSRSLKRLCADAGIRPWQRDRLPVLRAGGQPAAVPGIGTDASFAPQPKGAAVYVTFYKQREEEGHEQ